MLNRPATKIDLCLDEEQTEYEDMKQLRKNNPLLFNNQYANLSNIPIINNTDIIDQSPMSEGIIDKDSFFQNNSQFAPKEFNLGNVLFSGSSSKIPPQMATPEVQQFQTPDNK